MHTALLIFLAWLALVLLILAFFRGAQGEPRPEKLPPKASDTHPVRPGDPVSRSSSTAEQRSDAPTAGVPPWRLKMRNHH